MAITMRQNLRIGAYIIRQRLNRREKFPLVLQLEPLYQCNLACAGCGKIQHSRDILSRRLTVQQCIDAIEECGAPVVSIAGGEPLVHKEIDQIVAALVERKHFVYLCTNAILMGKKLDRFKPSPYFSWSVHIDGLRERHDESVCREGVFDQAVAAVAEAKRRGFRVTTNTTFFTQDNAQSIRAVLDFLNDDLQVDAMQISPGYAYEKAPDQEHFLDVEHTRETFRAAFAGGKRKTWRLNHSPLFLDFIRRQGRLRLHRVGHPQLFGPWLAEAVLPTGRWVRRFVSGTHPHNRMGQIWARQRSALRQLHGALRL